MKLPPLHYSVAASAVVRAVAAGEPGVFLIAGDPLAPAIVRAWAAVAVVFGAERRVAEHARDCASAMGQWASFHPEPVRPFAVAWRGGEPLPAILADERPQFLLRGADRTTAGLVCLYLSLLHEWETRRPEGLRAIAELTALLVDGPLDNWTPREWPR